MAWKAGVSMKITHTASVNPVWTFFAKPQQINWGWRLLSLLICSFFWLLCSINLSTHAMAYCEYFGSCARWWARCLNHVADGLILAMTPYDMRHILTDIDTPPSPTLNAWHLMSGPQGHWWLQRMVRTLKPRQGSLWAYSQRSQIEPNSMGRPRISVGGTGRRPVARGTWLLSALALGGRKFPHHWSYCRWESHCCGRQEVKHFWSLFKPCIVSPCSLVQIIFVGNLNHSFTLSKSPQDLWYRVRELYCSTKNRHEKCNVWFEIEIDELVSSMFLVSTLRKN